ncbi:hypothetical protein CH063_08541 [Colletotrichum higginsianum]|uniref:Uncharacterized protein n=1 Tax=Colletotrichum higginsianum (strain IMI 349063) TaxID=759273 RepID=H1VA75_COLHI|nr:hypothetical protein CH063_08541 [Colletotrichum higginsianum]
MGAAHQPYHKSAKQRCKCHHIGPVYIDSDTLRMKQGCICIAAEAFRLLSFVAVTPKAVSSLPFSPTRPEARSYLHTSQRLPPPRILPHLFMPLRCKAVAHTSRPGPPPISFSRDRPRFRSAG